MGLLRIHDVTLVSPVPVLDDFAEDLGATISHPVGVDVELHIGLHRPGRLRSFAPPGRKGLLIGIQTEHIFDAVGHLMWQGHLKEKIVDQVRKYDAVLDLSFANRKAYGSLPATATSPLHFGPHIFPQAPRAMAVATGSPTLFVGAVNERRQALLDRLEQGGLAIARVPPNTFRKSLRSALAKASSVLNLHFAEGSYTEAPRILKAVLAGKPVISEDLAHPFVAGQHYLPLDQAGAGEAALRACYERMVSLLSAQYSLSGFLRKIAQEKGLLAQ
jgi:hypothetical protein